jgi:DNA-binding transcriptional LysR family regulator
VLIAPTGVGEGLVDAVLRRLGRTRRVTVRTAHFLVAPLVIAESDHILTMPERLVSAFVPLRQFALLRPPVDIPPFSMAALWHPRQDADPGHQWMRDLVARISSSAPSPA